MSYIGRACTRLASERFARASPPLRGASPLHSIHGVYRGERRVGAVGDGMQMRGWGDGSDEWSTDPACVFSSMHQPRHTLRPRSRQHTAPSTAASSGLGAVHAHEDDAAALSARTSSTSSLGYSQLSQSSKVPPPRPNPRLFAPYTQSKCLRGERQRGVAYRHPNRLCVHSHSDLSTPIAL